MGVGVVLVCGVGLGLIFIYNAVLHAADDMETFDSVSFEAKLKKPEGWKTGKMPADIFTKGKKEVRKTADIL
nr:hypothetical protein [Cytophagales bacterium]